MPHEQHSQARTWPVAVPGSETYAASIIFIGFHFFKNSRGLAAELTEIVRLSRCGLRVCGINRKHWGRRQCDE